MAQGNEKARFRIGCKPSSVCPVAGGENHLSERPYPKSCPEGRGAGNSWISYLVLHPMGLAVPPRLLLERWALTPPFHPYPPPPRLRRAVRFLWRFPSGRLAASSPACIPGRTRVTRHRALWCSDFPPPHRRGARERFSANPKSSGGKVAWGGRDRQTFNLNAQHQTTRSVSSE